MYLARGKRSGARYSANMARLPWLSTCVATLWAVACVGPTAEPEPDSVVMVDPEHSEVVEDSEDSEVVEDSEVDSLVDPEPVLPSFGPGFVELTADLRAGGTVLTQPADLEGLYQVSGVAVGDTDHDGAVEVHLAVYDAADPYRGVLAWRYEGGELVRAPDLDLGPRLSSPIMGAVAFFIEDVDGDGLDDVLLAASGEGLAFGRPTGAFGPSAGLQPNPWTGAPLANPWAAGLGDVDDDGWLDLLYPGNGVGNSPYGAAVAPHLREAEQVFTNRSDLVLDARSVGGYAVLGLRLPDGASWLAAVGDIDDLEPDPSPGFLRRLDPDVLGFPSFNGYEPTPLTAWFKWNYPTGIGGVVWPRGAPIGRAQPMGATVSDLDGDGSPELVVAVARSSLVVFGGLEGDPWVDRTLEAGLHVPLSATGAETLPWGLVDLDLDQDGARDLAVSFGDDYSAYAAQNIGPQHLVAWWNAGSMRFLDATAALGLDMGGSFHGLCTTDLDDDGDADLMVVGSYGHLPRVYRNEIETPNHGLSLQLVGTTSNHLGIGARIELQATPADPVQAVTVMASGSPSCVSEPLAFFGLGEAEAASMVRVTWPSGLVQELTGLAAGTRHVVTEPSLISLSASDRHLVGEETVTVEVHPRDLAGALRTAVVTIESVAGTATFTGAAAEQPDGSWRRELQRAGTSTSSVIEVHVDGVPVAVRPRVWWD